MPTVCVTGATSYIGAHIVSYLLTHTSAVVHSTVRKLAHPYLEVLKAHPNASNLKLFVADLSAPSDFKAAFAECDVIIHAATPVLVSWDGAHPFSSYEDFEKKQLIPAVDGVSQLMKIAKEAGAKRFVLTGSSAAVMVHKEPPSHLDESVWSDEDFMRENLMGVPDFGYLLAKTVQEREAVRISKELGLELSVCLPTYVFGPSISGSPQSSLAMLRSIVTGHGAGSYQCSEGNLPDFQAPMCDVRDVAEAHVKTALMEKKPEDRYLLVADHKHAKDMYDIAKGIVPDKVCSGEVEWKEGGGPSDIPSVTIEYYGNERMKKLLGRDPVAFDKTISDSIEQFKAGGHF